MTNLMVNGCANGFWVRVVTGRCVVQRGRYGMLDVDGVIVAELVQLVGGDARLDEGADIIEEFGRQSAGDAHFFDVFECFEGDAHFCRLAPKNANAF